MSLKPKEVDFESIWADLLDTVREVVTCGPVKNKVWNDRFTDVYALCVAYPEPLSDRLYKETRSFLEDHVRHVSENIKKTCGAVLLVQYYKHWEEFSKGSDYLNMLYTYLNTQFIRKQKYSDADLTYGHFGVIDANEHIMEIGELALDLWKRYMVDGLLDPLVSALLDQIKSDRLGQTVNTTVIHGVINSFVEVGKFTRKATLKLYEDLFESKFLKETGEFYRQLALNVLDKSDCSEYMQKVLHLLDDEDLRSRRFLHPNSYQKVRKECEQRMVGEHLVFLHEHCPDMVTKERETDLSNMYRLTSPTHINGVHVLASKWQDHIEQQGKQAVGLFRMDMSPEQYVEQLLEVHAKYHQLNTKIFFSDQLFIGALDKACSKVINHKSNPRTPCRSPEVLAKYCDQLLKKGTKGTNESETDDKLSTSITIFKYLDDKDIFQRFYARMLAKRLIYNQSQSMDFEEVMISRLKQTCGYEFTNKLHRMFTDVAVSTELMSQFHQYLDDTEQRSGLVITFTMMVLQAGAWPLGQSNLPPFTVPQELEHPVKLFEKFYAGKFNGRKLTWLHNVSSAEVKFNYLTRPYFVSMTSFQMAVLLVFNTADVVSVKDIVDTTSLPLKETVKQVQSLSDTKILVVQPSGAENLTEDTMVELNLHYSNKRTKFKINAATQKDTPQEVEVTHQAVEEDRKLYLHAAIVRIMKSRKVMKHNLLIQEVLSQSRSRFAPSISLIKKCIETLIDKAYLERTQSTDEYGYIA